MVIHICNICNYKTSHACDYNKHVNTKKHINNIKNKKLESNIDKNDNVIIIKMDKLAENQNNLAKQNEEVKKQNEEVLKQNEELRKKIEQLEQVNNQNTNKIVKEARSIKKSILTILNTNFKDTPSIDYIIEDDFRTELELEYKAKIVDKENKLFMRIFSDFENKKLIKRLAALILKFVKKEDQQLQPVFNIDSARGNYATKIENYWLNDKSGLQLKKYTLDVIVGYMIKVMDVFRQNLITMCVENKKKKDIQVTDYIMKYQGLLLEVNAFLTNSNTHKKVILFMCPELRLDQDMIESIAN
jgi:hypothetical protein